MSTPNRFEDRLLDDLRSVVAARPAPVVPSRGRAPRPRLVLAGAGVAAVTATVAIVASGGDVTPSAYAVDARPDGAVTVSIRSLRDADGLQRSLRAAGVPAVVDYVAAGDASGCAGPGPGGPPTTVYGEQGLTIHRDGGGADDALPAHGSSGTPPAPGAPGDGARRHRMTTQVRVTPDGATFTIDPGKLAPGEHVYITTSTGALSAISMAIGTHRPAACAPQPPTR
jgi:hypothetical protein